MKNNDYVSEVNNSFYKSILQNKLIPRRIKTLLINTRFGASGINRETTQNKKSNEITHYSKKDKNSHNECLIASGAKCEAIGIDTKIVSSGKCNHPEKRFIKEEYLDSLPIPEHAWTHCIFCSKDFDCYFAGECEHKVIK